MDNLKISERITTRDILKEWLIFSKKKMLEFFMPTKKS